MEAHVTPRLQTEPCRNAVARVAVRIAERKLEACITRSDAEFPHQAHIAQNLVLVLAPQEETIGIRAIGAFRVVSRALAGTEEHGQRVEQPAAAVQLQRKIETPGLHFMQESR